ncbi:hypothetical protein DE146DRAFT_370522 [Phaeosphaeria sp. MPI-PUGE-AT-0046c]|nr:hypothetical protein DE146DRAFT_370522 [Phaeosphaeria sp. MPI-PUGE-AT-0046c]
MSDAKFRVIIVGAGPIGLYLAHAMERAKIDYVLLEQHCTVLNPSGQLVFTWPQTVRLLDQLGLYEAARDAAISIHYKKRVWGQNGQITSINRFWDHVEPNHGYPFLPILRSSLVRILHESLEHNDRTIITNAEVVNIETHAESICVHLHNGNKVDGSIVIGADGVHSRVREIMYRQAGNTTEHMASNFHGIFGWADISDLPIEREVFFESRGAGAVIQCLGTPNKLQFTTLKPLPGTMTRRQRYSRQEMDDYAASLADVRICPGVTFKDVWARADKDSARMLNQEEGFMSYWHHNRMVLVGDAVHKSTSVNGLGMTCGLHSAAVLANLLHDLVACKDQSPSVKELDAIFSLYQQERQAEVKPVWDRGYSMLREVTQGSWLSWLWDKYVLPWIDIEELLKGWIPSLVLIRYGNILSYVPFVGEQGSVRWLRQPIAHKQ